MRNAKPAAGRTECAPRSRRCGSVDREAAAVGDRGIEGHRCRIAGPALDPGVVARIDRADVGGGLEERRDRGRIEHGDTVLVGAVYEAHRQRVGEIGIVVRTGVEARFDLRRGHPARTVAEVHRAIEHEGIEHHRSGFVDRAIGSAVQRFGIVDAQARRGAFIVDQDRIDDRVVGETADTDRLVAGAAVGDEGGVRDARVLARGVFFETVRRVGFDDRIADAGALDGDHVLHVDLDAGVGVEAVVFGADDDQVAQVELAAEEFDAVIRAVVAHDVAELRARTGAAGGERLQFAVARQDEARVADLDVAHAARAVGRGRAAEPGLDVGGLPRRRGETHRRAGC